MRYAEVLEAVIEAPSVAEKAALLSDLVPVEGSWEMPSLPELPGRPASLRIVADPPRRRRGLTDPRARARFLHAIWHIEVSAIDLAVLICLRASGAPLALHHDFLRIAREEAEHATLVANLLTAEGFPPGSDPVHHRLWEAARTCVDLGEQLVVIPRFLEARGLDVSAELLPRLESIHPPSHAVISRIYRDEIGHVGIGTTWHRWWCQQQGLDPVQHFTAVIQARFADQLPSPFALDRAGRGTAGFVEDELAALEVTSSRPPRAVPSSALPASPSA